MIAASQMFIAITIAFNEDVALSQIIIFLSGVVVSAIIGYVCLVKITTIENNISLNNFHGHMYEHPKFGLAFLLASLGLAGFPFTPTFLGIDLLFSHIHTHQFLLIGLTATSFVFLELALLRLYARVFLGPHVKSYHEIAYKSS
jgi:formate hydrogenlyase subunit 3/multisubunit Na+/H+ antiporter MnhD subunit